MEEQYHVYVLGRAPRGALYVGVTNGLRRRVCERKEGIADSHTKRYRIKRLVYYEVHITAEAAIARERALKRWRRTWKYDLVEAGNRDWRDLYTDVSGP